MNRHARASLGVAAIILFACAAAPAAAQGVSARLEAGLSGIARAGRWMPVVVLLENTGRGMDARVTVSVDAERVWRDVQLPSPSRKRLEFYLRAPDADTATVRVEVTGGASASAPVRIVPSDSAVTACVSSGGVIPTEAACSVVVDAAGLPASWRGFDAADRLVFAPGGLESLDQERRNAHARWAAVRSWNSSTAMAPTAPAIPADTTSVSPARPLLLYAAGVLILAFSGRWLSRRPAAIYVAIILAAIAGSAAVVAHGRFGENAALQVREASVIRAGAALDGAQVQVRGTALFPASSEIAIWTTLSDGEMAIRRGGGTLRSGFDPDGSARIDGRATQNQRLEFEVDGFLTEAPLTVTRVETGPAQAGHYRVTEAGRTEAGHYRVTNRLAATLVGCILPSGFEPGSISRIEPGASAEVRGAVTGEDAVLICHVESTKPSVSWSGGRIAHRGNTVLAYDLRGPEPVR